MHLRFSALLLVLFLLAAPGGGQAQDPSVQAGALPPRSQAAGTTAPAGAPPPPALVAWYGLVGWDLLPFTADEQAEVQNALQAGLGEAQDVRIVDVTEFPDWVIIPALLQQVAVQQLGVPPGEVQFGAPTAEPAATSAYGMAVPPGSNPGGGRGKQPPSGGPGRRRQLLQQGAAVPRRMLAWPAPAKHPQRSRLLLADADYYTYATRGLPNSGVIFATDVPAPRGAPPGNDTSRAPQGLAAALHDPEFLASIRAELNYTSGNTAGFDWLATTLPGNPAPDFDAPPRSNYGLEMAGAPNPDFPIAGSGPDNSSRINSTRQGPPRPPAQDDGSSLSAAAIAGIALASVAVVALALLAVWQRRRIQGLLAGKRRYVADSDSDSASQPPSPPLPPLQGDGVLKPEAVTIQKRADGSDWLLGEGAMGSVYRGLLHGKLPVAIKVLRGSGAVSASADQEIAMLKACRNTNIVQFQGVVLHKDCTWIVQELCEADLFSAIGRGRVSFYKRGRQIALDVARGLHFLHSNKIVHLDLKSPNVLLSAGGTAKICDVGLARILSSTHITQANLGTFAWCAPEVLLAQRAAEAADIFSYGVLLWEIVTAQRPVRGQLRDVEVPEECPQQVADLIQRCIRSDPALRPTAAEIIEVLNSSPGRKPTALSPASSLGASSAHSSAPPQGVAGSAERASLSSAPAGGADHAAGSGVVSTAPSTLNSLSLPELSLPSTVSTSRVAQSVEASLALPGYIGPVVQQQQQHLQAPGQGQPPLTSSSSEAFDAAYAELLASVWQQAERAASGAFALDSK